MRHVAHRILGALFHSVGHCPYFEAFALRLWTFWSLLLSQPLAFLPWNRESLSAVRHGRDFRVAKMVRGAVGFIHHALGRLNVLLQYRVRPSSKGVKLFHTLRRPAAT
jgi:hypothetical protein